MKWWVLFVDSKTKQQTKHHKPEKLAAMILNKIVQS